jgi:hypothetical protein
MASRLARIPYTDLLSNAPYISHTRTVKQSQQECNSNGQANVLFNGSYANDKLVSRRCVLNITMSYTLSVILREAVLRKPWMLFNSTHDYDNR